MDEEEVWIILHSKPKETDSDLIIDASMWGRYRMEQIQRWRQDGPRYFMYRDINAMLATDMSAHRRRLIMQRTIQRFKEGTNVGGDYAEAQDYD